MATEIEMRMLRALEKLEAHTSSAGPTVTVNSRDSALTPAVAALERRVEALEEANEKTENKSYADLKDELKRYKDSQSHWTRYAVTAVITLLTGGFLLWVGRLIGKQ